MGKDKLKRFAENLTFSCMVQPEFDEIFHKDHPLKAVTICYLSEALEGQQVVLHWQLEDCLAVEGSVAQTDANLGHTKTFTAKMEF